MFQHISGFAETAFILLTTNYNYSKEMKREEKKMKEGEVKRKDAVYDAVDTLWMSYLTQMNRDYTVIIFLNTICVICQY